MAAPARAWGPFRPISHEERLDAMARARVWQPVDTASMDLLNGPGGPGSYKAGEEVRCKYEEKDPQHPIGGHSKKFPCHDARDERLKIKYDAANSEVYGEVLGARLFWALGFYAERMYSVKIVCENCPADPFVSSATTRMTRVFEPATIQKRLPGEEIAEADDIGWDLQDLDLIDESRGGSPKDVVDAFKLLLVLVEHGDDTANQQRLICTPDDPKCAHPLMYVTDLGGTFGGRTNETSFRLWSKRPIWKDPARCTADFSGTNPDFKDPRISEAGRRTLADLLGRLSDKQIADLFRAARVDVLAQREPAVEEGGKSRRVTVDDWVRAFKKKRAQIASARCPA